MQRAFPVRTSGSKSAAGGMASGAGTVPSMVFSISTSSSRLGMDSEVPVCMDASVFQKYPQCCRIPQPCLHKAQAHHPRSLLLPHIVGDEHDRGSHFFPELAHQLQDLCLNGYVQRCGGLVRDKKARLAGNSHGDHDSLAHTS